MMATSVISFKPLTRGRYRIFIDGVLGEITKNPKKFRISYSKAQINRERIKRKKRFLAEILGHNDWL